MRALLRCWRSAFVGTVVLLVLAGPARAQTQTDDQQPLSAVVDGLGALQLKMAGSATGNEFVPRAGLELRVGGALVTAREPIAPPKLSDDKTAITSTYRAGSQLEVAETVTALNTEPTLSRARLTYALKNLSGGALTVSAAEFAKLVAPVDGKASGARSAGFVGGLDRLGRRVGLEEATGFTHVQAGLADEVFDNFRTGKNLNDQIVDGFTDLAIGAQWDRTLEPGEVWNITVEWRVPFYPSTLQVTSTDDLDDGSCSEAHCTLREAVHYVPDRGAIVLPAGAYRLNAKQMVVDVPNWVTIVGDGARTTIIDAGTHSRIFEVRSGKLGRRPDADRRQRDDGRDTARPVRALARGRRRA